MCARCNFDLYSVNNHDQSNEKKCRNIIEIYVEFRQSWKGYSATTIHNQILKAPQFSFLRVLSAFTAAFTPLFKYSVKLFKFSVSTEQGRSDLRSCLTTVILKMSDNVCCRHSKSGFKHNAIVTTASFLLRYGKGLGYHFFLLRSSILAESSIYKGGRVSAPSSVWKDLTPYFSLARQLTIAGWKRKMCILVSSKNCCAKAVLENPRFQGFCSKMRTQQEKARNWNLTHASRTVYIIYMEK